MKTSLQADTQSFIGVFIKRQISTIGTQKTRTHWIYYACIVNCENSADLVHTDYKFVAQLFIKEAPVVFFDRPDMLFSLPDFVAHEVSFSQWKPSVPSPVESTSLFISIMWPWNYDQTQHLVWIVLLNGWEICSANQPNSKQTRRTEMN